ncbi:MAG: hypothetical protein ABSB40_01365 [Nitrososphaeria archaeon]|jgi:hypothetical protein
MAYWKPELSEVDKNVIRQADKILSSLEGEYILDLEMAEKKEKHGGHFEVTWFKQSWFKPKADYATLWSQTKSVYQEFRPLNNFKTVIWADRLIKIFNLFEASGIFKKSDTFVKLKKSEEEIKTLKDKIEKLENQMASMFTECPKCGYTKPDNVLHSSVE